MSRHSHRGKSDRNNPRRPRRLFRRGEFYRPAIELLEDRTLLFSDGVNQQITSAALPFLSPTILTELNQASETMSTGALPFANSTFAETAADIDRNFQTSIGGSSLDAAAFGQALHEAQDFYSETNWVDLGLTTLVDGGAGPWGAMTPYTIRSGAMLVEGTDPTPFGAGSSVARVGTVGFNIQVTTGENNSTGGLITYPGVVSGGPASSTPNTPLGVISASVAKDSYPTAGTAYEGQLYGQAYSLAVAQTQHEFYRLVEMIEADDPSQLPVLLDQWIKNDPASMQQFQALMVQQGTALSGGAGDVISVDLAGEFGKSLGIVDPNTGAPQPVDVNISNFPAGAVVVDGSGLPLLVSSNQATGPSIGSFVATGAFYFIPPIAATPPGQNQNPATHPGFVGQVTGTISLPGGLPHSFTIDVEPGYSSSGPNAVSTTTAVSSQGALDIYRLQQRLLYLGFPGPSGQPLTLNGDAQDASTLWAAGLFNHAAEGSTVSDGNNSFMIQPAATISPLINDPNAPRWQELAATGAGWQNVDDPDANTGFAAEDFLTNWSIQILNAAGEGLASADGPIRVSNASLVGGGENADHPDQQAGLSFDVALPAGMAPAAIQAQLQVFFSLMAPSASIASGVTVASISSSDSRTWNLAGLPVGQTSAPAASSR